MKTRQRVQASLLCLGLLMLVLLTQLSSVHVLYHRCVGERCVVCHQVQENQHRLQHTAHIGGSGVQLSQLAQGDTLAPCFGEQERVQGTLISLKVKLSN